MGIRILIVEDETSIHELLSEYFEREDYEVQIAEDGFEALKKYHEYEPHIVILDRMLPDISGDQVCEEIRRVSGVPILMLTAKSDEVSRIEGFEMGVDDYVTKPFSAREVILRANALIKRSYPELFRMDYDDGYLTIDFDNASVKVNGNDVHMTANEMAILDILFRNRPKPLSRSQLVEDVFGYAYEAYDRNIDTYIKNIRHKIEQDPKAPVYIMTRYGIGYYFGKK